MTRSLRRIGLLASGVALTAALLAGPGPARADRGTSRPCLDVHVILAGRTPVRIVRGVQFYRWTYRVYGWNRINRGLSHWVLSPCSGTQFGFSDISSRCIDNSDPPDGTTSNYIHSIGKDPTTGVDGLKWDFVGGNAIDKPHEYDEFSFLATGAPVTTRWAAKGSTMVVFGTVPGPGCTPVPVERATWGAAKTFFR